MGKTAICAFVVLSLIAPTARAQLQIKNERITYGPFGAKRTDMKFLPDDFMFMTFDMLGLTFDAAGKANYKTTLELLETPTQKVIFKSDTDNLVAPLLGAGTRMPGELHIKMAADQASGKYTVRLTVEDMNAKPAAKKSIEQQFELLKAQFGMVGMAAPAVGFTGQHYGATFALANMKIDDKGKPNVDVIMRVVDDKGKKSEPMTINLPKDMPPNIDLKKENLFPMQFPIFLNRAGRFTVEIEAIDQMSKTTSKLSYPLRVVDIDSVTELK